jgi:hypothetical protein
MSDRDPLLENTLVGVTSGGTGGALTPLKNTRSNSDPNNYRAVIKARDGYNIIPGVSDVKIDIRVNDTIYSTKTLKTLPPSVTLEYIISVDKSSNYTTDKRMRVHFSVDERDPDGNTSIQMADESQVSKDMTLVSVTKNPDTTNTYYAVVKNDQNLNFEYGRMGKIGIMNKNRTVEYFTSSYYYFSEGTAWV